MTILKRAGELRTMVISLVWGLIGASVGGFLSAEAFSYGSIAFALGVLIVPSLALVVWARRNHDPRHWKDCGGYLMGAGLLGGALAVPQVISSGLSNGPVIPAVLYLIVLIAGVSIWMNASRNPSVRAPS